jgi:hypothetical protein
MGLQAMVCKIFVGISEKDTCFIQRLPGELLFLDSSELDLNLRTVAIAPF